MGTVIIDNRGIPPLAGICSYGSALKEGYSVGRNVDLLRRYNYVKKTVHQVYNAHLARTPEWEVKCAFSYHLWLEAEHCADIRKRVSEMREPPLKLDEIPDQKLKKLLDEVIRAEDTLELLVSIYQVIKPEIIKAMKKHLDESNPMADQPTYRLLKIILMEEEEMLKWGETAISALIQDEEQEARAKSWVKHLTAFLQFAGGITGETPDETVDLPDPRADGKEYEMDAVPQRDGRFTDNFNQSALIDDYFQDSSRSLDERTYALLYKRLREMDVPEWMAPIIFKTKDQSWDYYVDMSRQLWDEARHAMLGEIGLYQAGVPFYKYPVDLKSSMSLNIHFDPLEAHLILWAIEQGLMPKKTGKQWEWEIATQSENKLAAIIQDYDWADEVLHTQIGRKWLVPQYGGLEKAKAEIGPSMRKWGETQKKYRNMSKQEEWWTKFMEEVQRNKALNR
ncbi:hypothetical protein [Alkalihalobacillus sp. TS-13]|uniref:hypothetical protein n=1 Tax=Alkalihalobacillus sp. TS-13 TaxID=2842455 RepID=UPI001C888FF6|nr:hypothetical protein [Alkalihalobacillus sp. TS-13]